MIYVNDEQPMKASFPIEVIEVGIMICFKHKLSRKALSLIIVIECGIATLVIYYQKYVY